MPSSSSVHVASAFNETGGSRVIHGAVKLGPLTRVEEVEFDPPSMFGSSCTLRRSRIGRYTASGDNCAAIDVTMGSFCSLGDNIILNAGRHPQDWLTTHLFHCNPRAWNWFEAYRGAAVVGTPFRWRERVQIDHDVWIGNNVVIVTGVTVGTGAIIGASSVVTRDVRPYAVMAGIPAREVRRRFENETVDRLLRSDWWERPIEELSGLAFDDVGSALRRLEEAGR